MVDSYDENHSSLLVQRVHSSTYDKQKKRNNKKMIRIPIKFRQSYHFLNFLYTSISHPTHSQSRLSNQEYKHIPLPLSLQFLSTNGWLMTVLLL